MKYELNKRAISKNLRYVALVLAVALSGLYLLVGGTVDSPKSADYPKVITYSTDKPDETKPDEDYNWQGRSEDPKRIIIDKIKTSGYIQSVGVDQNQAVAVPANIHIAGWFVESVRPGNKGLSIIDGHVDGRKADGIFKELQKLSMGDKFKVEMGSGNVLNYKVKDVISVSVDKTVNELFSQYPAVESQLNLITCGGNFDTETSSYEKRIIVKSELIK